MATRNPARIGLIGMGYIGSYVYEQIVSNPRLGLEVAFVADRSPERLAPLPGHLVLDDLSGAAGRRPDLVVEMAHPDVTRRWGESILEFCDYMPLSLTALADPRLHDRLLAASTDRGTCLYIPHGAVVGLDSLFECRDAWEHVSVTMRKNPRNLDLGALPGFRGRTIEAPTVLFDGTTREICPLFPRNVNSHAAVALAGIGFDRTRSVLVADPGLGASVIEIEASGPGVRMRIERSNELTGVSGVFTLRSIWACLCRARAGGMPMQIC
jgi:aspartate dehydrogenase